MVASRISSAAAFVGPSVKAWVSSKYWWTQTPLRVSVPDKSAVYRACSSVVLVPESKVEVSRQ